MHTTTNHHHTSTLYGVITSDTVTHTRTRRQQQERVRVCMCMCMSRKLYQCVSHRTFGLALHGDSQARFASHLYMPFAFARFAASSTRTWHAERRPYADEDLCLRRNMDRPLVGSDRDLFPTTAATQYRDQERRGAGPPASEHHCSLSDAIRWENVELSGCLLRKEPTCEHQEGAV